MKESYQMQFGSNMVDKWLPDSALPGFKPSAQTFMHKAQSVSEKLMRCFARGLGFPDDYFIAAHDVRCVTRSPSLHPHLFLSLSPNTSSPVAWRS